VVQQSWADRFDHQNDQHWLDLQIDKSVKSIKMIKLSDSIDGGIGVKKVTATELKTKTGECLDRAQKEPLEIEKNGRAIAVLIAHEDYERLSQLENAYWLARANASESSGYIGADATADFFKGMLSNNAET
jgi:prevent-host-death family protein